MRLLEVENLHKTYVLESVEVRALDGVSFSIDQGEFLAIMGVSGSGKSTLMHLLGLLDKPDQGSIRMLGKDVTSLSDDELAGLRNRTIGFIFQQFNLMARSTALENVALPLLYSGDAKAAEQSPLPSSLLAKVGLENRMGHRPNQLSGGQQQRVAIARALVNEPVLLFADEPTGNLDSRSGQEVMGILKTLHQQGLTIVLVTHDEKVAQAADRVLRMSDGKIVEDSRLREKETVLQPVDPKPFFNLMGRGQYSVNELKEHLNQASRMIVSNKMRSFLSMLGVLIGVACVITMLALGRGAQESVTEQLSRLGSNLLAVRAGSAKVHGISVEAGAVTRFTQEDEIAIRKTLTSARRVASLVQGQVQMVNGNKNWSTQVIGTTPDYAVMRNQEPIQGRFFTDRENQARERVVLLGQTVWRELFGEENPVGKKVKINRLYFQVIGILPSSGPRGFRDPDDMVVMPLLTAMKRVLGKEYLDEIDVEVRSLEEMEPAQEELNQLIIRRHRLTPDQYDSFNIRNYADIQEALSSTTKTFSVLLGCVAAISLVVGGVGIMNIMLVSVKERTREIGLRKAVGATKRDILIQFLVEAMMITFLGGLCGVLLSVMVSWGISVLANWKTVIAMDSLIMAFVFSVATGIIFGMWPAKQAAELHPIQALRYE